MNLQNFFQFIGNNILQERSIKKIDDFQITSEMPLTRKELACIESGTFMELKVKQIWDISQILQVNPCELLPSTIKNVDQNLIQHLLHEECLKDKQIFFLESLLEKLEVFAEY